MIHAHDQMLRQYRRVDLHSGVEGASSHALVCMLMDGALAQIATAAGHMERGDVAAKGEKIGRAISIIEGLKSSLDPTAGGSLADNLALLYDYMTRRLLEANLRDDIAMLNEIRNLLAGIKSAWDRVALEAGEAGSPPEMRVGR